MIPSNSALGIKKIGDTKNFLKNLESAVQGHIFVQYTLKNGFGERKYRWDELPLDTVSRAFWRLNGIVVLVVNEQVYYESTK